MKSNQPVVRVLAVLLLVIPLLSHASIRLPLLFSDNAVIQRDKPVNVWGWAEPGAKLTLTLGDTPKGMNANTRGEWQVEFKPLKAGAVVSLTVATKNETRTINNLIAGDIWVASGQSNMEWTLNDSVGAEEELAGLNNPNIRHFKVPKSWSVKPETMLAGGEWQLATEEAAGNFSGVAYFFAKKIQQETGVPIGIIGSNWGGSSIEAWMSHEALKLSEAEVQQLLVEHKQKNDAYKAAQLKQMAKWPGVLVNTIENADADWSGAEIDTSAWVHFDVPSLWEEQGYNAVDGVIWYRKTVTLTKNDLTGDALLGVGRIDDNDKTWVNGQLVGSTHAFNEVREYSVKQSILKEGENSIVVRVEDTGGGGGIYSSEELLFLKTAAGNNIPLAGTWLMRPDKVVVDTEGGMNQVETALYNKMLVPLFANAVKGVIWYQGESNAFEQKRARDYAWQFKNMIGDWRAQWQHPQMPFYWVQLASFDIDDGASLEKSWAILRDSQTAALSLPNTGHAITTDVGNAKDIHPRNKKTVGERLALVALHKTYGEKNAHYRGPRFQKVKVEKNMLIVSFKTEQGLTVSSGQDDVIGFEVVDQHGKLLAVNGKLEGSKVTMEIGNITVSEVRYAWDDSPVTANLHDTTGLPAEPFRVQL